MDKLKNSNPEKHLNEYEKLHNHLLKKREEEDKRKAKPTGVNETDHDFHHKHKFIHRDSNIGHRQ